MSLANEQELKTVSGDIPYNIRIFDCWRCYAVLHVAGIGKACEIAHRDLEKNFKHMKDLRDRLYQVIHIP